MNRFTSMCLTVLLSVAAVEASNYMFAPDTLGGIVKEHFARRAVANELDAAYAVWGVKGLEKACERPLEHDGYFYTCFVGKGYTYSRTEHTQYESLYLRLHSSKFEADISASGIEMWDPVQSSGAWYNDVPSGYMTKRASVAAKSVGEYKFGIRPASN